MVERFSLSVEVLKRCLAQATYLRDMLKRLKTYLGVESVKLSLAVLGTPKLADGSLAAELTLSTQQAQQVTQLEVWLTEQYTWGRGAQRRIESFELGRLVQPVDMVLDQQESVVLPFELGFAERRSAVDDFASRSILLRPLAQAARFSMGAKSRYTLHVRAKVKGVGLDPGAEVEVAFG